MQARPWEAYALADYAQMRIKRGKPGDASGAREQLQEALTIALQIGAGISLLIGYRAQIMAFLLGGLTLLISLFMHDFWNLEEGLERAHETQNFIKNMAIMAGLMYVAGIRRD